MAPRGPSRWQVAGLLAGPALFALMLLAPIPAGMTDPARRVAALALWMATWWLAVPVPIEATALLPLLLVPVLGVAPLEGAAAPYANPVIFLFLGGFLLAAALERWALHRRVAFAILSAVGTDARRVVLAFMLATAFLSMWISNTATAVMMMPMAAAVLALARASGGGNPNANAGAADALDGLGPALALGVAYAATIGGMATLIGTPPNAIFAGAARQLLEVEFGFGRWLRVGLPATLILLPLCWLLLVTLFPTRGPIAGLAERVHAERAALGRPGREERWTMVVFVLAVFAWVFREPKDLGWARLPGLADAVPALSDAAIAIGAALLLFAVPVGWRQWRFALDWPSARQAPWGMLLLFGGGLSLAEAFQTSDLTGWLGARLGGLAGAPRVVVVGAVAALFVGLSDLASNSAIAAMAMPLLAGIAPALGQEPLVLMQVAALAASGSFLLPVSTPPNALAFATGAVTVGQMARAGIVMDVAAVVVVTAVGVVL